MFGFGEKPKVARVEVGTPSAEMRQGEARSNENEWVETAVGNSQTESGVTDMEMIQPDAPLQEAYERGGYKGIGSVENQVPYAEEGEFLTPFQKQQKMEAMRRNIEAQGGGINDDEEEPKDEQLAA